MTKIPMTKIYVSLLCSVVFLYPALARAEVDVVKIPVGAGGVGFLPLLVMQEKGLIELKARELGIGALKVEWIKLGGPSVVNDLLISNAVNFAPAGPPAFITVWDRTSANIKVKGVAAMTSIPMYFNTRSPALNSIRDLTASDKIAVTAVKVSIPAIILQMAAVKEFGKADYDRLDRYTVSLTHPDGVIAMLSGGSEITGHFTSPPFHQRERRNANIRTIMTTNDVMGGPSTFTMLYTTGKFHDENPKVYAAVLKALQDSIAFINADKPGAAQLFINSSEGRGWKIEDIMELLNDPDIRFTTSPENLMKYANFMADVGSIKTRPQNWQEMFFPEIHGVAGN